MTRTLLAAQLRGLGQGGVQGTSAIGFTDEGFNVTLAHGARF